MTNTLDTIFFDKQESVQLCLLIVCVNYDDYLEETCKYNTIIFDKIYVITTPEDKKTHKICSLYNNVLYYQTNVFKKNQAKFNKGAALDYGLSKIPKNIWLVIGDADCIYPTCMKQETSNLDINKLYTYKRHKIINKQHLTNVMSCVDEPMNMVNRNVNQVLGYCQLFNTQSWFFNQDPHYPKHYKHAGSCDVAFSAKWPKKERIVLNCGHILHLGEASRNWKGRKTPEWK